MIACWCRDRADIARKHQAMKVLITNAAGEAIWERCADPAGGMTNRSYAHDGTLQKIAAALTDALAEAESQLRVFDESDTVPNGRNAPTEV